MNNLIAKNIYIGVDIVENSRFNKLDIKTIKRFLTKNEFKEYEKLEETYKINYLASRWSAKEAIFKAINKINKINLINIEILYDSDNLAYCSNVENVKLSISHSEKNTISMAIFINLN